MRFCFWTALVGVACVLGDVDQAFAWGPATHVGLASDLLQHLSVLPAAVAAVLARNRIAFIYGNIAADIVFAKRLSRVRQFCHHWSTAFGLSEAAGGDQDRAFAYGYLSHLAADTVAHGKYVPRQIALSECSVNFGHFFWELRADAFGTDADWRTLDLVLNDDHTPHHEALEQRLTGTFLPYELNRLLFDRMNAVTLRESFRRSVNVWNRRSRWYLCPDLVHGYRAESLDRMFTILSEGARSALLREDPNGTSALMHLRVRRREARRLKRRGLPFEYRLVEASQSLAPKPVGSGGGLDLDLHVPGIDLTVGGKWARPRRVMTTH